MTSTTAYRSAPGRTGELCGLCNIIWDVFLLLFAPCIPLARAQWIASASLVSAIAVFVVVTLLYCTGLVAYVRFANTSSWGVAVLGWILYIIGPTLDVVVIPLVWFLVGIAAGEDDNPSEPNYRMPWLVASVGSLMAVVFVAVAVRASLIQRFALERPSCCGSSCWVAFLPLCCVIRTIMAAHDARDRERQAQFDELPAYNA